MPTILKIIGVVALLLVLLGGFVFMKWWLVYNHSHFDDRIFDRQTWVSNRGNSNPKNSRGEMASDLIGSYLKKGMDRAEILELLGEPDFKPCEATCLCYYLGYWHGKHTDVDSLDICFDTGAKMMEAKIRSHE